MMEQSGASPPARIWNNGTVNFQPTCLNCFRLLISGSGCDDSVENAPVLLLLLLFLTAESNGGCWVLNLKAARAEAGRGRHRTMPDDIHIVELFLGPHQTR